MNRYTLIFNQKHLESLYQESRLPFRLRSFKYCSLTFGLMSLLRLIQYVEQSSLPGLLLSSSLILLTLLSQVVVQKFYKQGVQLVIFSQSCLLILLQLFCDHNSFLLGTNLAHMHCIYFIVQQFRFATCSLVLQMIAKLLISRFQDHLDISSILMSLICPAAIVIVLYEIERGKRNLFLSNNNEKNWHCILPSVITDPFILFTYDNERLNFSLKKMKNIHKFPCYEPEKSPDQNFKQFLRHYKYQKMIFEKFVLSQVDQHRKFSDCQSLELKSLDQNAVRQQISITFVELYHMDNNFIIILEKNQEELQQLQIAKNSLIALVNQHQQLVVGFLQKQLALVELAISNLHDHSFSRRVRLHLLYFLGKYRLSNSFARAPERLEVICFDFKDLFVNVLKEFNSAYVAVKNSVECTQNNYSLLADRTMVQDFLIQLIYITVRCTKDKSMNTFILHSNEHYIYLRICVLSVEELVLSLRKNLMIREFMVQYCPFNQFNVSESSLQIQIYRNTQQFGLLRKFE